MANNGMFQKRTLNVQRFGNVILLDAIATPDGARLFFAANTPMDQFRAGKGTEIIDIRSVGDAPILTCITSGGVAVSVGDTDIEVVLTAVETDLFEGLNVGF
ncbi:MAG TPA: hypothetical protein ENJ91_02725, partial [Rhodobacteraceae bacterium]|nr:hypothetical protein [Paracoccaceae bacterium]